MIEGVDCLPVSERKRAEMVRLGMWMGEGGLERVEEMEEAKSERALRAEDMEDSRAGIGAILER